MSEMRELKKSYYKNHDVFYGPPGTFTRVPSYNFLVHPLK